MKILFKNTTQYTKEKYNDLVEFHKEKYGRKIVFRIIALMLCFIYIVTFNIINKNWILLLVVAGIIIILYIIKNYKEKKQTQKRNKAINKKKEFTFIFYKRYIKLKYARKYDIIPYFKIYKIFETKEYFYIYTDENHSLILSKDGFEIGTPRKFTEFIKKKCPLKYRNEKNWDNN